MCEYVSFESECACFRKRDSWEWNALKSISVRGSCVWDRAGCLRTVWETEILPSSQNNTHMLGNPFLGPCFPLKVTKGVDSLTHWDNDDVKKKKSRRTLCKRDMLQYIDGTWQLKRHVSSKIQYIFAYCLNNHLDFPMHLSICNHAATATKQ